MKIKSNYVDIVNKQIYAAEITIENGKIAAIEKINEVCQNYALPGFIDAHVHIESSLLAPSEFARMAVIHGTVATVSDPHEIANVLGLQGIDFMIENGKKVPFHFFFGAPSCVPATVFETAGAVINSQDIDTLLARPEIL
jgi:adenine deaminase